MRIFLTYFILSCVLLVGCASLSDTGMRYRAILQDIQNDRVYFAVVNLKSIIKNHPKSPYAPTAAFALGEYYFDNLDYFHSLKTLSDYIHRYPDHKGVVFAKLIIYKTITALKDQEDVLDRQQEALIKEIRKELFSEPLFLIFYDKKSPRSYKSIFNNSYLVYDYVDLIKVFRNEKIFLELSP